MADFVTPPPLAAGDTLALVAPSRPISEQKLAIARRRLRDVFDLDVVVSDTVQRSEEFLRTNPEGRARDVMDAFANPDIDGVMAVTGGDDQLRVLPHLDPDVFRDHPTRFYGYSDNDNLRLYLWNLGIVSYGGCAHPNLTVDSEIHPYTERYYRTAFFEESLGAVDPADEWTDGWYDFETQEPREWDDNDGWNWWTDNRAEPAQPATGRVWGGCFAIVNWHLQTSRYLPNPAALDGAVLALEPSEELPRARDIGYLLRSMGERGFLERFDGVMVGRPRGFSPVVDREVAFESYRADIRETIVDQLREYNPETTAVFNVDFGHTDPQFPLPLGARVTLAPGENEIRFG